MRTVFVTGVLIALCHPAAFGQHDHDDEHGHADLEVGKTATNQIAVEFDFDDAFEVPPVDGPLLFGCALDDPGFMTLDEDEPDEGLFMLPNGTEIAFELVSIDPGLVIYTPGFGDTIDTPGETFVIGTVPFDVHPTWHIDSMDAAWDPDGTYSFTFRLFDPSGTCDPTGDLTATVVCAEPGACCLPDGECEDGEFEEACEDEGGEFLGEGSTCSADACEVPGACCLPDGECEFEHEDHCADEGGVFMGENVPCTPSTCAAAEVEPVPTVSTSGMMLLCVLLVAGLMIAGNRRVKA